MWKLVLIILVAGSGFAFGPQAVLAQGCRPVQSVLAKDMPPDLAGIVRGCIGAGDYEQAMANFYAFSAHILFDQQRVKDESAHVVVRELQARIFGGWSTDQMEALRAVANAFRDPSNGALAQVCGHLSGNGPPSYQPGYMIIRGIVPRKGPDDWRVPDFDPDQAWERALHELNNCPRPDRD